MALARSVLDNARLFGERGGGLIAENFLAHNRGHDGPLDGCLPPDAEAAVNELLLGVDGRERLSGVVPSDAPYNALLRLVGVAMGRDARRLYGLRGNIDPKFWDIWSRHFNKTFADHEIPARRGGGFYRLSSGKLRTATIQNEILSEAFNAARSENAPETQTVPT
jgi:hypothetical protein